MSTAPTPSVSPKPTLKRGRKPYLFHVESSTRPGLFHSTDTYRLTCSCEAGQNGRRCHHLTWALHYETWRSRQVAAAALAASAAVVAPQPVPFQETAGYKALAACFG